MSSGSEKKCKNKSALQATIAGIDGVNFILPRSASNRCVIQQKGGQPDLLPPDD